MYILGDETAIILSQITPRLVKDAIAPVPHFNLSISTFEDQDKFRDELSRHELVAFVGNGTIILRDFPSINKTMPDHDALPFSNPPELAVRLQNSEGALVEGMGTPQEVTIIIGNNFSRKSTPLKAMKQSVYNHVSGDGRELVVTVHSAVKVRAEIGRIVLWRRHEPPFNKRPQR